MQEWSIKYVYGYSLYYVYECSSRKQHRYYYIIPSTRAGWYSHGLGAPLGTKACSSLAFSSLSCWYHLPYNTHDNTPPRTNFEADFLNNGEGANAERCFYGKISSRSSRSHHLRCVCPTCFGEKRLGNSSQGVCYHACYTVPGPVPYQVVPPQYHWKKKEKKKYVYIYITTILQGHPVSSAGSLWDDFRCWPQRAW